MHTTTSTHQLTLECRAVPESVATIRRRITTFAREYGASDLLVEDIAIAISEASTNVVLHAYRNQAGPGPMAVMATVESGQIVLRIRDEGCGMIPRHDSPGAGLGLPLLVQLASSFELEESDMGLSLCLRFDLR